MDLAPPFPPVTSVLPHRPPFLFIERILTLEEDRVVAIRTFRADEPVLQGHFPGRPVVPAVVLVEALAQTLGYHALVRHPSSEPLLVGIDHARFRSPAPLDVEIVFEVRVGERRFGLTKGQGTARVGGRELATATLLGHAPSPHEPNPLRGGPS